MRSIEEIRKVTEEIRATGLIKVRYAGKEMGEHLWAKPLGNNTAELQNIPFQDGISLHDIVEYDADNNITKVLKSVTKRGALNYVFVNKESYQELVKHFKKNDVKVEGGGKADEKTGVAYLALPLDMTEERVHEIAHSSPTEIIALKISK
jgi:hypothetical protein